MTVGVLEHGLEPAEGAVDGAVGPRPGWNGGVKHLTELGGFLERAGLVETDVVHEEVNAGGPEDGKPRSHDGARDGVSRGENHGEPEHLWGEGGEVEGGDDLGEDRRGFGAAAATTSARRFESWSTGRAETTRRNVLTRGDARLREGGRADARRAERRGKRREWRRHREVRWGAAGSVARGRG